MNCNELSPILHGVPPLGIHRISFTYFSRGAPEDFIDICCIFITLQGVPIRLPLDFVEIASILQGVPLRISLTSVEFQFILQGLPRRSSSDLVDLSSILQGGTPWDFIELC